MIGSKTTLPPSTNAAFQRMEEGEHEITTHHDPRLSNLDRYSPNIPIEIDSNDTIHNDRQAYNSTFSIIACFF